ncbi:MAG: hypothetical protein IK997_04555 [Bacilli bacterium]|nr:hypothetical protein [Bacilli bacterium]
MNVIVGNERMDELATLDVDVIKSINGVFDSAEIVSIFKNFYFNKMILDATSVRDYLNINNIQKIANELNANKIIVFLPKTEEVSSKSYLSGLVKAGIYNFTNNIEGVKYLITHSNTYEQVAALEQEQEQVQELTQTVQEKVESGCRVLGIRNVTDHAGATTLIYMLKRELERIYGETVYALEVSKHDLQYFNVKNTISCTKDSLIPTINKLSSASIILIDLNDCEDESACGDILYLIEPSSIRLNKLMRTNRNIFNELVGKKIILNKSLLTGKDINDFEYEAKTKVFYNMPPLDERKKNEQIMGLIGNVGLTNVNNTNSKKSSGKILGLFRF